MVRGVGGWRPLTLLLLLALPVELALVDQLHEAVLLLEVDREIRREYGVLDDSHHPPVVLHRQILKDVVAVRVQDHHALVEVVVLHRARRVEDGEGRFGFCLEGVVRAAVVEVVAETGDQEAHYLDVRHELLHLAGFQHREHRLADVERVTPVVVLYRSVW